MTPRSKPVRLEPTEKDFTAMVIDFAQRLGWRVLHLRPAAYSDGRMATHVQGDGVGFPDLQMLRRDQQVVAELKVGDGTTTDEQKSWLAAFEMAGVPAYVWRPADIDGEILEVLR